jgi:cell division protein FtsB
MQRVLRRSYMPRLRQIGRILGAAFVAFIVAIVMLQFAERISRDVALSRELARTDRDIQALHQRSAQDMREIHRLRTEDGVVPYIYRRLRMVRPGQTMIYVVPSPKP